MLVHTIQPFCSNNCNKMDDSMCTNDLVLEILDDNSDSELGVSDDVDSDEEI